MAPTVTAALVSALGSLPSNLRVQGVEVHDASVRWTVCDMLPGGACAAFLAMADESGCDGMAVRDWCIQVFPSDASDDVRAAVARSIASLPERPWTGGDAIDDLPPTWRPMRRIEARFPPWLVGLLALVIPLACGLAAGAALTAVRRRPLRGSWAGLLLLGPVALLPLVDAAALPIGVGDLVLALFLFAIGLTVRGHSLGHGIGWSQAGVLVVAAVGALLAAEAAVRTWFPPIRYEGIAGRVTARLFEVRSFDKKHAGPFVFPDAFPWIFEQRSAIAAGASEVVLHVGDSMPSDLGVDDDGGGYPDRLRAHGSPLVHVNASIHSIGPDLEYLVALAWAPRLPASAVVLHYFPANDLDELDRGFYYCDGRPPLDYVSDGPVARCPEPLRRPSLATRLARDSYPLLLRALAPSSQLALRILLASTRYIYSAELTEEATRRAHLRAIIAALQARLAEQRIRLAVVVVPVRSAIAGDDPNARLHRERRDEMIALAHSLGVPVLDAWPATEALLGEGWDGLWSDRWHLSAKGHDVLAEWLAPRLGPLLWPERYRAPHEGPTRGRS